MPQWSVYIHTNKLNDKKYVGITSQNPKYRWLNGNGYSEHLKFGRAIKKYGWVNFEHEIVYFGLDEISTKEIEVRLIKELKTQDDRYGYNLTNGGDRVSGYHHSDDSKRKMSEAKCGKNHPNFGKHLPEETRNKIREKSFGNTNPLGVVRTEETKKKMSESKQKPVSMMLNGVSLRVFKSALAVEQELHVNRKNISACRLGHRKHAGGYEWEFA